MICFARIDCDCGAKLNVIGGMAYVSLMASRFCHAHRGAPHHLHIDPTPPPEECSPVNTPLNHGLKKQV